MKMTLTGILAGIAIIAGLIAAMGKMSSHGVDINDHFCCGSCSDCSSETTEESCTHYSELEKLRLESSRKGGM